MAIYVKGKTTCRICGQVLTPSAVMVGFPNTKLSFGLESLADSCLHRTCLDVHPRRDELVQAWRQHWVAQAERASSHASINEHAVMLFYPKRFVFAALDSFVDLEEALDSFDRLKAFFGSYTGRERLSAVASWNAYELVPDESGTRLVVIRNSAAGAASVLQDGAVLDYKFTPQLMASFAGGWAALEKQ